MPPALPQIVVNLKTYDQATGARAVAIAEAAAAVAEATGVGVAVAPQALDVRQCVGLGVPVFAQHFDRVEGGSNTGWTYLAALVEAGVAGSLINHSEHRVDLETVKWCVQAARHAGIVPLVCTKDAAESGAYGAAATPDAVAVEPPELIGGDISVTTADPEVVASSAEALMRQAPGVKLYCGAGVKTRKDVEAAVELGSYGILLASGVTKAKDPRAVLDDLARGFS
jgi:triosephosphate isomerase